MSQAIVTLPAYHSLSGSLSHHDPAELHGLLCGLLCADPGLTVDGWLRAIHPETANPESSADLLRRIYQATRSQLDSELFDFQLLLPTDEQSLNERSLALGDWCQGFLSGLGLGGLNTTTDLTGEIEEFIQDVSQIAQLGFDALESDDSDETAYTEIVEYLRVGVLLVRQALDPTPAIPRQRLH